MAVDVAFVAVVELSSAVVEETIVIVVEVTVVVEMGSLHVGPVKSAGQSHCSEALHVPPLKQAHITAS